MTKRRPLPYTAAAEIDAALMENAMAAKALLTVLTCTVNREELYRLIGQAIHQIHESTSHLKTARAANAEQ